jgi:hypothetical protein
MAEQDEQEATPDVKEYVPAAQVVQVADPEAL